MKFKKRTCMLLVCIALIGFSCVDAHAISMDINPVVNIETGLSTRASGSFSTKIPANSAFAADTSFPLEAGETVTINASYSPASASVDFGLIAPNGQFYFQNVTGGSINKTIRVSERGYYTLAIRNNSSNEISLSGFVNY